MISSVQETTWQWELLLCNCSHKLHFHSLAEGNFQLPHDVTFCQLLARSPTGLAWVLLEAAFKKKLGTGHFCRGDQERWNEETERDMERRKRKKVPFSSTWVLLWEAGAWSHGDPLRNMPQNSLSKDKRLRH